MTDQTLEQVITSWYTDDARGSHLDFDDVPALVKRLEAFGPRTPIAEQRVRAMTRGTRFRAAQWNELDEWVRMDGFVLRLHDGMHAFYQDIDPSTIRDVTPPAVTS